MRLAVQTMFQFLLLFLIFIPPAQVQTESFAEAIKKKMKIMIKTATTPPFPYVTRHTRFDTHPAKGYTMRQHVDPATFSSSPRLFVRVFGAGR